MKVQKNIEVWLVKKRLPRPIDLVQYDTGIQLVFALQDFTIPGGTTATLYVQKPSGKFVYQETGITTSENSITIDLENQAITEHGNDIPYQVELKNCNDTVSTFAGIMRVEKSLKNAGAVESKTVIAAFEAKTAEQIAQIEAETLDQIASLQAASQTEQEAIENKGLEVLNTIPADYTATTAMAEKAIREKSDAIVCEAEGEAVAVADASDEYLRGLKLFGKTTQKTTTGAQLFDSGAIGANLYTTVSNDGVITVDMDNTGGASDKYATFYSPVSGLLKTSTQYAVVAEVFSTNGNGGTVYLTSHYSEELSQFDDTASLTNPAVGVHVKLAKTASTFDACRYMCRGFVSCPAGKHLKMSLRVSVLADTSITAETFVYEPFSGGNPAPNPEYPQDLNSVENPGVGVYGKNLIASYVDGDKTHNGVTFTVNDDNSITINGTATEAALFNMVTLYETTPVIRPGAEYIISGATNVAAIQVYEWHGNWVQCASTSSAKAFKLSDNAQGVLIRYVINPNLTANNLTVYPMLRLASDTDSTYEKGKAAQILELSRTLPGIPVSSGGNYTDANGQQWICDEVDLERGVYVQRVGKVTLTGEETHGILAETGGEMFIQLPSGREAMYTNDIVTCKCNYYPAVARQDTFNNGQTDGYVGSAVSSTHIRITDNVRFNGDHDALIGWVAEKYTDGNPVIFEYILAAPIETALTAEEIQAFKALHSNYPNTTVLNDAGAWMQVKYNADLKKYFKAKVGEKVSFTEAQDLTPEQQAQARENIGAASEDAVKGSAVIYEEFTPTIETGYYYVTGLHKVVNSNGACTEIIPVKSGDKFLITSAYGWSGTLIMEFDENNTMISCVGESPSGKVVVADYEYTVPDGVSGITVSTYLYSTYPISMKKGHYGSIADDVAKNTADIAHYSKNHNQRICKSNEDATSKADNAFVYDYNSTISLLIEILKKGTHDADTLKRIEALENSVYPDAIKLTSNLGVGTYTLKYEDDNGAMTDHLDICTFTVSSTGQKLAYNGLIAENVAPKYAKKIGVYDASDTRVGEIALGWLNRFFSGWNAPTYSFAAISDTHVGEDGAADDLTDAVAYFDDTANNISFAVICGDCVDDARETSQLETYQSIVGNAQTPIYVTPGNHEAVNLSLSGKSYDDVKAYFEQENHSGINQALYYSFEKNGDVFIMVGAYGNYNYDDTFTNEELQWLYDTLEANRNKRCFLFHHYFPKNGSGDAVNCYAKNDGLRGYKGKVFYDLLRHYKNVLYFHGHSHAKFKTQELNRHNTIDKEYGMYSIHIPSLSKPKYPNATQDEYLPDWNAGEGYIVDVYDIGVHLKGRDFEAGLFSPIGCYWLPTTLKTIEAGTFYDETGTIQIV